MTQSGYAFGRLQRALTTAHTHADPTTRSQARAKANAWEQVISGLGDGSLEVGSRTPVTQTPAWVTLEVVQGGFATGAYQAEGALHPHEELALARLPQNALGETARERLNIWYLSDGGQDELLASLTGGTYTVDVPEEAALLTVACLIARGHASAATALVRTLQPWFARLRFYPRLEAAPRPPAATVRLRCVDEVRAKLDAVEVGQQMAAMIEALTVWNPLYDRLVELWADTVQGQPPVLVAQQVEGGWPCRSWPSNWEERRAAWLADYRRAARESTLCGKHAHPKSNFHRLAEPLQRSGDNGAALSGRDVGWVRRALANTTTRRGAVNSLERRRLRTGQAELAALPTHGDLAKLLSGRLSAYPGKGGIPDFERISVPADREEHPNVPAGSELPPHLLRKTERAIEAPIDELVQRGVIGSAEVLATVLPQITAQVAAGGFRDDVARDLYGRIYAAFRRRRSLLLLNLESQVRIGELPWVAALEPLREEGMDARLVARTTLTESTQLVLNSFPHTLLPNPLVSELRMLAKQAGLELPLVDEVAADIFMGAFTTKWRRAARIASELLAGTLYARYYDLPPATTWPEPKQKAARQQVAVAQAFSALCKTRAEAAAGGDRRWSMAQNGTVIEQSQILTTHNLAALVGVLELRPHMEEHGARLAEQVFGWVVRRQGQRVDDWRARLQMLKNTAYAWRQALFFLSFAPLKRQRAAVETLQELTRSGGAPLQERFSLAVAGLRHVVEGGEFGSDGSCPAGRRFLGWSVGRHWLVGEA